MLKTSDQYYVIYSPVDTSMVERWLVIDQADGSSYFNTNFIYAERFDTYDHAAQFLSFVAFENELVIQKVTVDIEVVRRVEMTDIDVIGMRPHVSGMPHSVVELKNRIMICSTCDTSNTEVGF